MIEIKTDYTKNIICPFCGHEDKNSWEVDFGGSTGEGETEVDCGSCGETFMASRSVTVDYSSRKKGEKP